VTGVEETEGPNDRVVLRLKKAEALVLFDWLHQHEDDLEQWVEDPAELAALWAITNALEQLLSEPFRADYVELLEAARAKLRPFAE
jgi:hypothetical protein